MLPCHTQRPRDAAADLSSGHSALYDEVFGSQSAAIVSESPSLRKGRLVLWQGVDSSGFFPLLTLVNERTC